MKKNLKQSVIFFLVAFANIVTSISAQEVQGTMKSIYKPFRDLQFYTSSPEIFHESKNDAAIRVILETLSKGFHKLDAMPSKYRSQPGFDQNVQRVIQLLDDSARRFRENKKDYSYWYVRTLPNNCFGCHVSYKVESIYADLTTPDPRLDLLSQAKFLLATRQFQKAREVLLQILRDQSKQIFHGESLRSLLLVHTRIGQNPKDAIHDLTELSKLNSIAEEDKGDINHWIDQLKEWKSEPASGEELVEAASDILIEKLGSGESVSLLYATAMLHKALESKDLDEDRKREALYLLGYGYSELQGFFINGWAELYLEECINRYGGTLEAKNAFKIYKELLVDSFTGSMGTDVPSDIILKLSDLRKKAYGIPNFDGRI